MAILNVVTTKSGVDTSKDTVTAETLLEGVTAHDASGKQITGSYKPSGGSSNVSVASLLSNGAHATAGAPSATLVLK